MKRKNTLRPSDIKYEPITTKKQPLWMHSIDRPAPRNEAWRAFAFFLLICVALYIFLIHVYPVATSPVP